MSFLEQSAYAFLLDSTIPIYFSTCGITEPQEAFTFTKELTRFGTYIITKGTFHVIDELPNETKRYSLKKGDIHTMAPGLKQETSWAKPKGEKNLWYNFVQNAPYKILTEKETKTLIQSQFLQNIPQKFLAIPIHFESKNLFYKIVELFDQLHQQVKKWGNTDIGSHILCNHLIYIQHQELVNRFTESLSNNNIKRRHVRKAQDILLNSSTQINKLSQLADILQLTPSYLSRCFKEYTGVTVQHYIQQRKIEVAILMLRQGNKNIKSIAFETGYSDIDYFCKVFKKITGKTVSSFKQNIK